MPGEVPMNSDGMVAQSTGHCLVRTGRNLRNPAMAKCSVCNKGPMFGHNRSHSMRATNRMFKPNIFKRRMVVDGEVKRVNICARCLRTSVKLDRD